MGQRSRGAIVAIAAVSVLVPLANGLAPVVPMAAFASGQLWRAGIAALLAAFLLLGHRWARVGLGALLLSEVALMWLRGIAAPGFASVVLLVEGAVYLACSSALFFATSCRQWFASSRVGPVRPMLAIVYTTLMVAYLGGTWALVYLSGREPADPLPGVASAPGLGAPPPGYPNSARLTLALFFGWGGDPAPDPGVVASVVREDDVEYCTGGGRALRLDVAGPKGPHDPAPALIFVHGGAWEGGNKRGLRRYIHRWAERGYVAASIEYRLRAEATFPAALHDTKCAVRWLRAHASERGVDPDRIALVGFSAGGHLVLLAAYTADMAELEGEGGHADQSSRVRAVVSFYGPTDLRGTRNPTALAFLGPEPGADALASPMTHLDASDPPTLLLHGTVDNVLPVEQSDLLAARLRELRVPYAYARLPGWGHVMDAAAIVDRYTDRALVQFLDQHLAAKPSALAELATDR